MACDFSSNYLLSELHLKQSVTMGVQIGASGTREHENHPSSSITKKQRLADLSVHADDFQCQCRHNSIPKIAPPT